MRAILAMPHRDLCMVGAAQALFCTASRSGVEAQVINGSHSLLEHNFNALWAQALNMREDFRPHYFAMLHDDIVPQVGWLDVLIEQLEENDADIVSAVVPIKDHYGLTSTGAGHSDDEWGHVRRVTMTEAMGLPLTFGREDLDWPEAGDCLMVNTGCWACRFDSAWVEPPFSFRTESRIVLVGDQFVPQAMPEDWLMSIDCHNMGLNVMATRAVSLFHAQPMWNNQSPWGAWQEDEAWKMNHRVTPTLAGLA